MCSPTMMIVTSLAGAAFSAVGSYQQAVQQQDVLNQQAEQAELQAMSMQTQASLTRAQAITAEGNARLAEMDAEEAELNAEKGAKLRRIQAMQLIGEQKSGMATSGVSVNSGSAVSLYAQTAYAGEIDAQAELSQGDKNSLAYRMDAANYLNNADALRVDATGSEAQSLAYSASAGNLRSQANSISPFGSALGSLVGSASTLGNTLWSTNRSDYINSTKLKYGV